MESSLRKKVRDVEEMFGPDGNWDDYWLGNPPSTNSFMDEDQSRWTSADNVVKDMTRREIDAWSPEDSKTMSLMQHGTAGGGLYGVEDEYFTVLSNVLRAGERALDKESEMDRKRVRT